MKIIYRISDTGYHKSKPDYVTNENCLRNFCNIFKDHISNIRIIADSISRDTDNMIQKYLTKEQIHYVNVGHGAGTFNLALDMALIEPDNEVVYFVENDYIHKPESAKVIEEGFKLGADFLSLYDHPDKYIDGINPYITDGGEDTKVFLSDSCHWKLTNSTTMTFASTVNILKQFESTLRYWTSSSHPHDFDMWIDLRKQGASLITPIPSYSTHGETAWLSPLINWNNVSSNS